jgi:hypothetical protein
VEADVSISDLLISRLAETKGPLQTPCWIYQGDTSGEYGVIHYNGKAYKAHRVAFETWVKQIGCGLSVLHHCDTPLCCNPAHLFEGTQYDNVHDMINKGRAVFPRGEHNGRATISEETAKEIKDLLAKGLRPIVIQQRLSISKDIVFGIKYGRIWRHL